jgi:hypothetical protein
MGFKGVSEAERRVPFVKLKKIEYLKSKIYTQISIKFKNGHHSTKEADKRRMGFR